MKTLSIALVGLCCLISSARADEITVSAAASLRDALTQIGADFAKTATQTAATQTAATQTAATQTTVRFNFGSSGTLQSQIEAGAPVDLFIAASTKNVRQLASQGDLIASTQRVLASGELVLIAPRGSKLRSISDLRGTSVQTIAIGGPGVPAGDYARQTLKFLHLESVVTPKLVFAKDVRSVLAQVAAGNADAGFTYRTDALLSKQVQIVAVAPPRSHDPVTYPMAVLKDAPNRAGALRFWRYLQNASAKRVLKRFGFGAG